MSGIDSEPEQETLPIPTLEQVNQLASLKDDFTQLQTRSASLREKLRDIVSLVQANFFISIFSNSYRGLLILVLACFLYSDGWIYRALLLYLIGILLLCIEAISEFVALHGEDSAIRENYHIMVSSIKSLRGNLFLGAPAAAPLVWWRRPSTWWRTLLYPESESVRLLDEPRVPHGHEEFYSGLDQLFTVATKTVLPRYQYFLHAAHFGVSILLSILIGMVIPVMFVRSVCRGGKGMKISVILGRQ